MGIGYRRFQSPGEECEVGLLKRKGKCECGGEEAAVVGAEQQCSIVFTTCLVVLCTPPPLRKIVVYLYGYILLLRYQFLLNFLFYPP